MNFKVSWREWYSTIYNFLCALLIFSHSSQPTCKIKERGSHKKLIRLGKCLQPSRREQNWIDMDRYCQRNTRMGDGGKAGMNCWYGLGVCQERYRKRSYAALSEFFPHCRIRTLKRANKRARTKRLFAPFFIPLSCRYAPFGPLAFTDSEIHKLHLFAFLPFSASAVKDEVSILAHLCPPRRQRGTSWEAR